MTVECLPWSGYFSYKGDIYLLYVEENRVEAFAERWEKAEQIFYELRGEAESAIEGFDDMERQYGDARYLLFEAEDRIAELEKEIELLQETIRQLTGNGH